MGDSMLWQGARTTHRRSGEGDMVGLLHMLLFSLCTPSVRNVPVVGRWFFSAPDPPPGVLRSAGFSLVSLGFKD